MQRRLGTTFGSRTSVALALCVACTTTPPPPTRGPSDTPQVALGPRDAAPGPHDDAAQIAGVSDPSVVDVAFASIAGQPVTGRTGDLHASFPNKAFVILVHAPSTDDSRFFRHAMTVDGLFHPHDPAPSVLYVFSPAAARLAHVAGRHAHQVEPASAAALSERYGEFAVLVLDARGTIRLESREPATRDALQRALGHRDRRPPPRPPPPGPIRR